jgi:hypothetical protein
MTQPETAVGGEATPVETQADPKDYFEQLAAEEFGITDEEEEPAEGAEEQSEATEEAEDDTAAEEEADDLPPIDAPVSWDAEAKEVFKNLPREAQEIVAKREGERERFVQQKSQEATRARQDAEQAAIQQLAQIEQGYAQHFQQLAEQIAPQRPNPALLQHDPMAFYAQQAAYEESVAQQRHLQQRSLEYAQQAQAREAQAEQAFNADQHRIIVENFPEYADPTSGPKLRAELSSVAKEMGYTDELIAQARAADILAMRKAAEWKAKADQLDRLNRTKMEKVRAAKGKPPVTSRPGVTQGGPQLSARNAQSALEVARTSKNRDVQGAAFFDYLKNTGQI